MEVKSVSIIAYYVYIYSHVFHNKVRKFTHICDLVVHVCRYTRTRAKPYNCILALASATPTRSRVYTDHSPHVPAEWAGVAHSEIVNKRNDYL